MVRFAAVDSQFGNTGSPRGRPRAGGAHRKQPAKRRVGSAGFDRGVAASELNRRRFLGALAAAEVIQHMGARPESSLKELAEAAGLI